jgi:hypothetical protein
MDYGMTVYVTGLIGKAVERAVGSITSSPPFSIGGGGGGPAVPVQVAASMNVGLNRGGN